MKEADDHRLRRYKEKISYILECLDEIQKHLPNPSDIILYGIYYALSTAIEAAMNIIAMLCKDLGIMPKGDYENIQSLTDRKIIDGNLSQSLS
ncbi:MAG: DUF86 domain-containing protein, partial [Candidatus Thorarchaeota archaeon]|nr:DUF86 domain-containing protein [Candidatus Thorarchaeota archaeon]